MRHFLNQSASKLKPKEIGHLHFPAMSSLLVYTLNSDWLFVIFSFLVEIAIIIFVQCYSVQKCLSRFQRYIGLKVGVELIPI